MYRLGVEMLQLYEMRDNVSLPGEGVLEAGRGVGVGLIEDSGSNLEGGYTW